FRGRRPLVSRVGPGRYVRYGSPVEPVVSAAVEIAPDEAPTPETADMPHRPRTIALVGCGRSKRDVPAPASDLYTSRGFRLRAAYAEQEADRWFVLSAEYGLVGPDEWISPYDLRLSDTRQSYRQAWGEWVVARLIRVCGPLDGRAVHVIAPADYADP